MTTSVFSSRPLTAGEVCSVSGVASSTLDRWTAAGLLGPDKSGREQGRGHHRTFTAIEALALAAGMRWVKAGADADRVQGVVRFIARQPLEHLEAEFAAGRTFPVPPVMLKGFVVPGAGGIFIKPETKGGAVRLMNDLDLARLWDDVQAKIAKLGNPPKRGRRPKHEQVM